MAKKAARAKVRRLGRTSIRLIGNPVSSYIDAHGDDPPYHDQHSDGGTYYDHPDNEHNDFHHDEAGKVTNYRGDPVELVSEAISRLETMLTKFEVVQRQRLQSVSGDVASRLDEIESRIIKIEQAVRQRR